MGSKFQNEDAANFFIRTLESQQTEDLGDAETFGWFAYFEDDSAILQIDSEGFVWIKVHETPLHAAVAWSEIQGEWFEFDTTDEFGDYS